MRTIDRIYQKISSKPSKKAMLQAKLKQGYMPTKLDRKNLMIIMKRNTFNGFGFQKNILWKKEI